MRGQTIMGEGTTLLSYGLRRDPDPLQAGGVATLTLVMSNGGDEAVTCTSIELLLPVGTDASNLIANGASITTRPAPGWTIGIIGGLITFTASKGGAVIEGEPLIFTIGITVNGAPGTTTVTLQETASSNGKTQAPRATTWTLDKFPADFSLSDLMTVPQGVDAVGFGDILQLTWLATGTRVSCNLDYLPANDGPSQSLPVPNAPADGAFQTVPLTRDGDIVFTLTAKVSVLGRDNPLVAQSQLVVAMKTLSLSVVAVPPTVGVNGLVRFQWYAPNSTECRLEDGTRLPPSGIGYFVLQASRKFTVFASGGNGQMREQAVDVTVDPSIVPTEAAHATQGGTGGTGSQGTVCNGDNIDPSCTPSAGGTGGRGGDTILSGSMPPLDSSGRPGRVIAIALTGGAGGTGGMGGCFEGFGGNPINPQPSGQGGDGGNAVVDITLDAANQAPAQYIVTLAGGPPGGGGASGDGSSTAGPGSPGAFR